MEVTLQIDPDIQAWLNRIIEQYGRTPEYWLMELARANRENLEDSLEADRALEEMRIKGEKPIPAEEVKRKYGIQD